MTETGGGRSLRERLGRLAARLGRSRVAFVAWVVFESFLIQAG